MNVDSKRDFGEVQANFSITSPCQTRAMLKDPHIESGLKRKTFSSFVCWRVSEENQTKHPLSISTIMKRPSSK